MHCAADFGVHKRGNRKLLPLGRAQPEDRCDKQRAPLFPAIGFAIVICPSWEEENPALRRELAETAQILRSEDEFLEQLAQKLVDGWAEGEIPIVAPNEHIALVRRALKLAVSRWYGEV